MLGSLPVLCLLPMARYMVTSNGKIKITADWASHLGGFGSWRQLAREYCCTVSVQHAPSPTCKGLLALPTCLPGSLCSVRRVVIAVDLGAFLDMDHERGNHRASSQTGSTPRGMGKGSVSLDIVTTSGTSFPPDKTRHALVKPKLTPYPPGATPIRALIPWPHVSTNFATTHPIASLFRTGGCFTGAAADSDRTTASGIRSC